MTVDNSLAEVLQDRCIELANAFSEPPDSSVARHGDGTGLSWV